MYNKSRHDRDEQTDGDNAECTIVEALVLASLLKMYFSDGLSLESHYYYCCFWTREYSWSAGGGPSCSKQGGLGLAAASVLVFSLPVFGSVLFFGSSFEGRSGREEHRRRSGSPS